MTLQHLRSSTANKRPTPAAMSDGQLAMNTNLASPGLFLKDSNGDLVKVGPVHVGTTAPNATPAVGGQAGNSKGEQWLDTSSSRYVFKIWDGTAWRTEDGEFVNTSGDTMTGALGIIAGSAATPGVFFSGDTNTGIYSPGADQVAISTNGTGRLFVDADGNIAAGTSATSNFGATARSFDINSAGGIANLYVKTGTVNGGLMADAGNGYVQVWTATSHPIAFNIAFSEKMRLDTSGRLGLGTSSPQSNLDVRGTASSSVEILRVGNGTKYLGIGTEGTNYSWIQSFASTALYINPLGNNTILNSGGGSVGIGTTAPGSLLDLRSASAPSLHISETGFTPDYRGYSIDLSKAQQTGGINLTASSPSVFLDLYAGGSASALGGWDGQIRFFTGGTNAYGTERARIDSSGRLLVGTSTARSTFYSTASAFIQLEGGTTSGGESLALVRNVNDIFGGSLILAKTRGTGDTIVTSGDTIGNVTWQGNDGSKFVQAARIEAQVDGTPGADDMPGRLVFFTTADGQSTPTERMRIDAIGALKTSPNGTYKFPAGTTEITHNDATSSIQLIASSTSFTGDAVTISTYRNTVNDSYKFLSCIRQGFAVALEIRDDGDVYNVNGTYGSLSDAKLKENIIDAQSQWDDIRQLRVRNYNFKPETNNSTHKQIGVIAQEIEDVSPGLVNTVPDRDEDGNDLGTVTKSVNYSVLYMKAVKALQEAMERIEALEADVAQLKGA